MKYDPKISTTKNLANAGFRKGKSVGLIKNKHEIERVTDDRVVFVGTLQAVNEWLRNGCPSQGEA